jgi:hypothetical protein
MTFIFSTQRPQREKELHRENKIKQMKEALCESLRSFSNTENTERKELHRENKISR